jgi:hypothetical protein
MLIGITDYSELRTQEKRSLYVDNLHLLMSEINEARDASLPHFGLGHWEARCRLRHIDQLKPLQPHLRSMSCIGTVPTVPSYIVQ